MMNNVFPWSGWGFGFHVHFFFGLLVFTGLILLIFWAVRFLKREELKSWIAGLIVVGLIGWLLTAGFGSFWFRGWSKGFGPGMMMGGMFQCAQDEDCFLAMKQMMERMGNRNDER